MSRVEWILGIVLLILLAVVVGLALSLWLGPNTQVARLGADDVALAAPYADDVAPTREATAVQTAKSAYITAEKAAKTWQPDAILVNATATWPQGVQAADLKAGQETWGFIFYSPTSRTTAVVSLTNGVPSVSPRDNQRQFDLLDVTSWQLDSSDAVIKFLDNGGDAFIQREGITVYSMTLSLNDPDDNGRIVWLMTLLSTQNGHSLTMKVDAASGEVLEVLDAS